MSAPTQTSRTTRRYEWATFEGVWNREFTLFKRFWLSTTISSVVQPIIYLFAFGLGVGTLVSQVDGISYVEFVGTGSVATAVLFASAFPGMFNTYVRRVFQRTYDALLAAPVSVDELALAEATWIAAKAGFYGSFPLIVTFFFGLTPTWGMLLVPIVGFVTGLGFAFFGMWVGATIKTIEQTTYITSIVLTPLFLVAGTFSRSATCHQDCRWRLSSIRSTTVSNSSALLVSDGIFLLISTTLPSWSGSL